MDVYKKMLDHILSDDSAFALKNNSYEWDCDLSYFVCHKKHAYVVLSMLRGAKGQCRPIGSNQAWSDCNLGIKGVWRSDFWYCSDKFESRIVATV